MTNRYEEDYKQYIEEYWAEKFDDINTALSHTLGELRDLRHQLAVAEEENAQLRSMLSRIQIAMSQGLEL
jgi:regulator of replication initiation timing